MKKDECEIQIRRLARNWAETAPSGQAPSFSDFRSWLSANDHGGYFNFRSVAGPIFDAEAWFDDELGQNWRN